MGRALEEMLRPHTYPIAMKLVKDETEFPEKTRRPQHKLAICQAFTMSRRYGWTVGLTEKDSGCPGASLAYGWRGNMDEQSLAKFFLVAGYASDEEGAMIIVKNIHHLEVGKYRGVVISPLTSWASISSPTCTAPSSTWSWLPVNGHRKRWRTGSWMG